AFSPDCRRVITGGASFDVTTRVWDVATGQPLCPLLDHAGEYKHQSTRETEVVHTAFLDGGKAVTVTRAQVRIWDLSADSKPAEDWVRITQFVAGKVDRFGAELPTSSDR